MTGATALPTHRFWIMGGRRTGAKGGFHDFLGSVDSLDRADQFVEVLRDTVPIDWWHVFDSEALAVVSASSRQGYLAPDSIPTLIDFEA